MSEDNKTVTVNGKKYEFCLNGSCREHCELPEGFCLGVGEFEGNDFRCAGCELPSGAAQWYGFYYKEV